LDKTTGLGYRKDASDYASKKGQISLAQLVRDSEERFRGDGTRLGGEGHVSISGFLNIFGVLILLAFFLISWLSATLTSRIEVRFLVPQP
jgi:hypothetical protein